MSETASILAQQSTMIIFTYAAAGLGHLRVTDALYRGLPGQANPILLRSEDSSVGYLHHLTSMNPFTRSVLEWTQAGQPEELFTRFYRNYLRTHTHDLSERITTLLDERLAALDTILVIATHFGLAHQLAAIKAELSRTRKVNILLVVQVTDDSPQHIWYVAGADLIVVPSEQTKTALVAYGRTAGLPPVRFEVLPYPISPLLAERLTEPEYSQRQQALQPAGSSDIEVAIPVSGAAVGLDYFRRLMDELYRHSSRFRFQIVAKTSPYTRSFLEDMAARAFVTVHQAETDRETVELYERVYQNTVVGLEVTKPSEQAFKALIDPRQRGGALLLFSHPVGRQEHDNIDFMERHQLLPTHDEQQRLWDNASKNVPLEDRALFDEAIHWRGIRLPDDPKAAAQYLGWSLEQGICARMLQCTIAPQPDDPNAHELGGDGVRQFWELVSQLLLAQPHT